MSKYDKIKNIAAVVMLVIVFGSFTLLGKDHPTTRTVAASAMILWLAIMFWANWKKKSNQ